MIRLYSVQVVTRMMGIWGGGSRESIYPLSADVHRATSSALMVPYGRILASRKLPPRTSPRYCDQESKVPLHTGSALSPADTSAWIRPSSSSMSQVGTRDRADG